MKTDLVIIGGGFAGRQACRALRGSGAEVCLIDPNPYTTMLPALPDIAGGWVSERLARHPLRDALPPEVRLLAQAVRSIDLDARQLVAGDETIDYQQLLIAPGSTPRPAPTELAREHLHTLGTLQDAVRIRESFAAYLQKTEHPLIVVAGSGYTGLELALSLFARARAAGKNCRAAIVDPKPILLPSLPEKQRQYVLDFLHRQGIRVQLGSAVDSFDGRSVVVAGETLPDVFFCWAAGSVLAIPEIRGNVERLRDGRLKVAPDLSLPDYPDVFAAGDAAALEPRGEPLRKAVNFAYYGGRCAGRNLARRRRGRPTRPFRPVDLGWVVPFHFTSLGRLPLGIWVHGRLGLRLHHLMCGIRNYSLANFAGCLRLALNPYPKGTPS